jgi:hypothetical protein
MYQYKSEHAMEYIRALYQRACPLSPPSLGQKTDSKSGSKKLSLNKYIMRM